jgi:hypothetical protein
MTRTCLPSALSCSPGMRSGRRTSTLWRGRRGGPGPLGQGHLLRRLGPGLQRAARHGARRLVVRPVESAEATPPTPAERLPAGPPDAGPGLGGPCRAVPSARQAFFTRRARR